MENLGSGPLLLVGCGKMGGALLAGWLTKGLDPAQVYIVEPFEETASALRRDHGVHVVDAKDDLPDGFTPSVVLFAIKPQMMDDVVSGYRPMAAPGCVFLSVAAGKTSGFFEGQLGERAAIVRAMPNTPASVGRGATVAYANDKVSDAQVRLCHDLLSAVGLVQWAEDESLIDAVTAVSGSGPAYVFWMVECLAEAGRAAGLPADMAEALARETISGAGELLHRAAETPTALRENVTSPGGTTAAALDVLMAPDGLEKLMTRAVAAAANRSRELSG